MLSGGGGTCDFRQSELSCGREVRGGETRHGARDKVWCFGAGRGVFSSDLFIRAGEARGQDSFGKVCLMPYGTCRSILTYVRMWVSEVPARWWNGAACNRW